MATLLSRRAHLHQNGGINAFIEGEMPGGGKEIPEPIHDSGALSKEAPIWKAYVLETDQMDKEMGEDWDKTLDTAHFILTHLLSLVFAALFSAIATAFILESMKQLQPDPAEVAASTLLNISRTLVAISNRQSVPSDSLNITYPKVAAPSHVSILVNSLWLSSLCLSLGVSLMAMLAKRWCLRFLSGRSGPYHEQARRRQKRWDGIVKWRMQDVMNALPLLMHISLALFAVGLVLYLWEINRQVAMPVLVIVGIFFCLYAGCTALPFISRSGPYGTTLSDVLITQAIPTVKFLVVLLFLALVTTYVAVAIFPVIILHFCGREKWANWLLSVDERFKFLEPIILPISRTIFETHQARNPEKLDVPMDLSTAGAISWLASNSEHADRVETALKSISGASVELSTNCLIQSDTELAIFARLKNCFGGRWDQSGRISLKEDSDLALASTWFQALSHLLQSDHHWGYKWDKWNRHTVVGSSIFGHGIYPDDLVAVYRLLLKNQPDASKLSQDFVLCASALMPAAHWTIKNSENAVQLLVDKTAQDILSTLTAHSKKKIKLSMSTLSAISGGCAHYLVSRIWQKEQVDTTSQIVYALLQIFAQPDGSPNTLKYALAVALASAALAAQHSHTKYHGSYTETQSDAQIPAVRLLRLYSHRTKQLKSDMEQLQSFGILGSIPLLPFESLSDNQVSSILSHGSASSVFDSMKSPDKIKLKGSPSKLDWYEHALYTVYNCLQKVPATGSYRSLEFVVGWCLEKLPELNQHLSRVPLFDINQLVSWICRCETEILWDNGLTLLDVCIDNREDLDRKTLGRLAQYEITARLFECSISDDPMASPVAMNHLWKIVQLILSSQGEPPNIRLSALDPLLKRNDYEEIRKSFGKYGLPDRLEDMAFESIWYDRLNEIIKQRPILTIDGRIIKSVLAHHNQDDFEATESVTHVRKSVSESKTVEKWRRLDELYEKRRAYQRWLNAWRILRVVNILSRAQAALSP
ncbi:activating signal cointegrator 1 complex subunit 3 [Ceratobasidium sp. AG-Ba]|nr:activating signal cointegrator 1 complex subunit 3 [Ceratobasidium sp. AG-Ba]QRW07059.1 activating signal cointegrator 1 complex subunit 3 [Ceratobasidium sp. AG-Ba]